jgi:hypothetical protein
MKEVSFDFCDQGQASLTERIDPMLYIHSPYQNFPNAVLSDTVASMFDIHATERL